MQKVSLVCTLLSVLERYSAPGMGQMSRQSLQFGGHFVWLIVIFPCRNLRVCIAPGGSFVSHMVQQGQCSFSMFTLMWTQLRSGSVRVCGSCTVFPSVVW